MVEFAQWYRDALDDTDADAHSCPWCGTDMRGDVNHEEIGGVTTCYNMTPPLTV